MQSILFDLRAERSPMNQGGVQLELFLRGVFLSPLNRLTGDCDGYLAVTDLLEEVVYVEGLNYVLGCQVRHLAHLHDVERLALVGLKKLYEDLRPIRNVAQFPKLGERFFW